MFFSSLAQRSTAAKAPATAPATAPTRAPVQPIAFQQDTRSIVTVLVMYVAAAVGFLWCGIAAMKLRRWVRPVMLVVAWTWLVSGLFGTAFSVRTASGYREIMAAATPPGTPAPPPQLVYVMVAGTVVFTAVFMIALPGLLVYFFQRRGVRQTLEHFDPRARWTDRCPTPVLAVSFWLVLSGASCLSYIAYGILPLFGRIVTGPEAIVGMMVSAVLLFALAWLVYVRRPMAWWATVAVLLVMSVSMITTVARLGVEELYRSAGYTSEQIRLMTRFGGVGTVGTVAFTAVAAILMTGYLLYVRRYFFAAPQPLAASG
jgi:hypothetical protein